VAASPFENIFAAVQTFCKGHPFSDDVTIVELTYRG